MLVEDESRRIDEPENSSNPSLMTQWDNLEAEIAELQEKADIELISIAEEVNAWVKAQDLPWITPNHVIGHGHQSYLDRVNTFKFYTENNEGKPVSLSVRTNGIYDVLDGRTRFVEQNVSVLTQDVTNSESPVNLGTTIYYLTGKEALTHDGKIEEAGIAFYPHDTLTDKTGFPSLHSAAPHDEYRIGGMPADAVNMRNHVRMRHPEIDRRIDPIIKGRETLNLLLTADFMGQQE